MIETISNNYDNIISKIDQNSNEESLNILNNLEELQNKWIKKKYKKTKIFKKYKNKIIWWNSL